MLHLFVEYNYTVAFHDVHEDQDPIIPGSTNTGESGKTVRAPVTGHLADQILGDQIQQVVIYLSPKQGFPS